MCRPPYGIELRRAKYSDECFSHEESDGKRDRKLFEYISSGTLASCLRDRNKLCDRFSILFVWFSFSRSFYIAFLLFSFPFHIDGGVPLSLRTGQLKRRISALLLFEQFRIGGEEESINFCSRGVFSAPEFRSVNRRLTLPLFARTPQTEKINVLGWVSRRCDRKLARSSSERNRREKREYNGTAKGLGRVLTSQIPLVVCFIGKKIKTSLL